MIGARSEVGRTARRRRQACPAAGDDGREPDCGCRDRRGPDRSQSLARENPSVNIIFEIVRRFGLQFSAACAKVAGSRPSRPPIPFPLNETENTAARRTSGRKTNGRAAVPAPPVTPPARAEARAAETLGRAIVVGLYEGRYVPGQRLIEPDLMAEHAVSRSTVREALTLLEAEGVVRSSPFRGAWIHRISRAEADEILTLLETLMGLACRLAAARIGEDDGTRRFRQCFDAMMRHENAGDGMEFLQARNEYFRALVGLSGNGKLRDALRRLNVHLLRVQMRPFHIEGDARRFEDYRSMAQAILAGDARQAERAGRRYIRRVAAEIERLPARMFAP